MTEFALFIGGDLRELRFYPERPADIPHKKVVWHPVLREYGDPFSGLEGDAYVIRTVDPASVPPSIPEVISRRQLAHALENNGDITRPEALAWASGAALPAALVAAIDTIPDENAAFDMTMLAIGATEFYRYHQAALVIGSLFQKSPEQMDELWCSGAML